MSNVSNDILLFIAALLDTQIEKFEEFTYMQITFVRKCNLSFSNIYTKLKSKSHPQLRKHKREWQWFVENFQRKEDDVFSIFLVTFRGLARFWSSTRNESFTKLELPNFFRTVYPRRCSVDVPPDEFFEQRGPAIRRSYHT